MSFAELRDLLHVAAVNRAQECVADAAYNHAKVKDWVQQITDSVIADCRALSLEFKWIVSVAIMQQSGAGMSAFTSAVGSDADGTVTAAYETSHVVVLVNVYGAGSG